MLSVIKVGRNTTGRHVLLSRFLIVVMVVLVGVKDGGPAKSATPLHNFYITHIQCCRHTDKWLDERGL